MSAQRFTPEFKEETVKQVTERGHSLAEAAAVKACRRTALQMGQGRFSRQIGAAVP